MTVGSGAVFQPIIGYALDLQWDGTKVDGAAVYTPENFYNAFLFVLATSIVGLITAMTLKK